MTIKQRAVLQLMRPKQWAKNGFVLLPLFFSGKFMDLDKLLVAFITFITFSLVASSIYCFNDLLDIDSDRQHPIKHERPLASGALTRTQGWGVMIILLGGSILIMYYAHFQYMLAGILISYFMLNLTYTLWLKHIAIVDVLIIAIGFVLRLAAGSMATKVSLSHWIILMTFLLALFLAFAKRWDDALIFEETGIKARVIVTRYNTTFLNSVLSLLAGVTTVCYIMYTVSSEVTERLHSSHLYLTSLFVIAGVLRYMQLIQVDQKSGSPTVILFRDRFIQLAIAGWIVSFVLIIYVL